MSSIFVDLLCSCKDLPESQILPYVKALITCDFVCIFVVVKRIPDKLYDLSILSVIENYHTYKHELRKLPETLVFDVYYKLFVEKRICFLGLELNNLDIFARMLKVTFRRHDFMKMFLAVMDHGGHGKRVSQDLAQAYLKRCKTVMNEPLKLRELVDLGLNLGGFLNDCGWYVEAQDVLQKCLELCRLDHTHTAETHSLCRFLECCSRLLHAQAAFCNFSGANETYQTALCAMGQLEGEDQAALLTSLYTEFSAMHFNKGEYDESYRWSRRAVESLAPTLPVRVVVDVLRQQAKACVVKREFERAGLIARQAMLLSRDVFCRGHPKYSDTLIDYGFYLLNFDMIRQAVVVYEKALDIRRKTYGKVNLRVAMAHEDLAYALYVYEYNSGRFLRARENAEVAIDIMSQLLPPDHLMLASVKRVKALILEEIALDSFQSTSAMQILLNDAEQLHLSALKLAMSTFGERNVQTAKHFGNLGRLYQSMKRLEEAEAMHLKAIAIKEELLGPEDYEVGLSIGHLASLYNYHMKNYKKAEQLYLRSINISLKLFGEGYSGLEYDYRGLVNVYENTEDAAKLAEYSHLLNSWKFQHDLQVDQESKSDFYGEKRLALKDIIECLHTS